jgi:serine/threonine protein kinase
LKDYEISVQIGQGAYGIVKRASLRSDGTKVALKQYDKAKLCQDQNRVDSLRAEISTLGFLDHPGIMKFHDAIDSGNKISIVVEYVNGNNLYQYIRKLKGQRIHDENEVKKMFTKIVESVEYMHSQNVIHRDLKLENILVDRET